MHFIGYVFGLVVTIDGLHFECFYVCYRKSLVWVLHHVMCIIHVLHHVYHPFHSSRPGVA